ncbi:MAG: FliM/FliN family flagellar motor switch protein [Phycisphaerae bacterium]|nr:FliM/FliN family flagellar motor switch protein [Phycisphaerae bacterium]
MSANADNLADNSQDTALWSLLASVQGQGSRRVQNDAEADVYDFLMPHRFTPAQREQVDDFVELATRKLTAAMSAVLRGPFQVAVQSIREEYADRIEPAGKCYYMPLMINGNVKGYLEMPVGTAVALVTQLLGGIVGGEVDDDRKLSSLESNLLLDMAGKMVEAFGAAWQECGGAAMELQHAVSNTIIDVPGEEEITEFCRLGFQRADTDEGMAFSFVLLSRMLEPIGGYVRPAKLTAEEARWEVLGHLDRVPMLVKVRLDPAEVAMRDIATLEAGDVMLLKTQVNQPIEMIVSGKTIMKGLPVQYKGMYALQIREFATVD